MLKNWIRIFLYHLKKDKLFAALNVLGLSIGIAGLIFAILYWNDEQRYNDWNPEKENVYQSLTDLGNNTIWANNLASYQPFFDINFPELEAYCYYQNGYTEEIIQYKNKKEIIKIIDAQKTFFEFFPFHFVKGDIKTTLQDPSSIAICTETASKLFGLENPIGKEVSYLEKKLVVKGVYTIPGKSSMAPMAVTNFMDSKIKNELNEWGSFNYGLLLKVNKTSDVSIVRNKMNRLLYENRVVKWAKEEGISPEKYLKKNGEERQMIILEPLSQARLHSVVDGYPEGRGNYQSLLIMVGLSLLILFLSIVNYVNMATANAIKRAKEVGLRKILGASKSNIIRQFIFETVLITSFSLLLALVIVELSLPYYNSFLGKQLIIYGSQFYFQLLIVFVISIVVAGIFPAVYVANFETLKVLKGNFGRSKSGVWLRNGMLIFQFAIASFFIIGSSIVYNQVSFLSTRTLGFTGDQIVQISYRIPDIDSDIDEKYKRLFSRYETVKQEIATVKGVLQVSTGAFTFGKSNNSSSSFSYQDVDIQGQNMAVDFGMLEMMKIELVQGRNLDSRLASDTINSMMINETALKQMKEKNPIGKFINWNGGKFKIIGVVKDFNLWGPKAKIPPMVFFHLKTVEWMNLNVNKIYIKLKTEDMENTIANLEKFWIKNIDSDYPFSYDFVDKAYARTYKEFVNQKNLFLLLNVVVIGIALFGLFALASYSIQSRMKEIAIRKTLGAETNVLLKELSKQYILYCIIGFLIALFPTYYLLNMWLENFAFRISISIIPFIIGFLILLSLTLVIVLSKAYSATRVNVLHYLKYE
jgi:putative ABC transport system permease protein